MIRTENDLWKILNPIVRAGIVDFNGLAVKRAYQPTTQSDGNEPRLLLHRVSGRRYGSQSKRVELRDTDRLVEIETWHKEDTYQAFALVNRAPDDFGYTAVDVLERLSAHLQSEQALAAFQAAGVGILRINEIQETPYEDDQNVWRMSVSLKFILTYPQSTERDIPAVETVEIHKHRL